MKQSERLCNVDKNCFPIEMNEDAEEFDDPSVDLYYDNMVRADDKERKRKEIRRLEKRVLR